MKNMKFFGILVLVVPCVVFIIRFIDAIADEYAKIDRTERKD